MSFWYYCLDKIPTKLFLDFCPEFFLLLPGGFLEAFWASWGLSIQYHKQGILQEAPKSFQEAPRKVQKISGQKSRNNFVGIFVQTIIQKGHFEINWPLKCCHKNSFDKVKIYVIVMTFPPRIIKWFFKLSYIVK